MRDTDCLRAFIAVVEEGGFRKAAARLHLAQPTVSSRIQSLEKELGCKLLYRSNRQIQLTEAGRHVYQIGKEMLNLEQQLKKYIARQRSEGANHISLGTGSTVGVYLMPYAITLFRKNHPQVHVDLQIGHLQETFRKLINKSIDIGILGAPIEHQDLEVRSLIEYEMVPVVASSHPLAGLDGVKIEDLLDQPFILREKGSLARRVIEEAFRRQGIALRELNVIMELNNTEALKVAVESGLGVSFISPWAIQAQLRAGTLKIIEVGGLRIKREAWVCVNKQAVLSSLIEEFLRFLASRHLAQGLQSHIIFTPNLKPTPNPKKF
ncbi:MAG: LysR family transcriptional regulator, transcriptional activator of the cysJI operon [Clostridia bacterium]|nr:LysR family transcriptional regulator, transcriptional activator of the cysJI operon [Clostridia bacterium]